MTFANMALIEQARKNISRFMLIKADSLARQFGFGYRDMKYAPNSFKELVEAWNYSKHTSLAFPVWDGCSDNTIYTSRGANYAFRFWHDSFHVIHGLQFTTEDEIQIGELQVREIAKEFGVYSLEWYLLYADTVGQTIHARMNNGEFPSNQLEFVLAKASEYIERSKIAA